MLGNNGTTPVGEVVSKDGEPMHGMTVCNVPIGSKDFVEGHLDQRMVATQRGCNKTRNLLDPGRWPNPDIPTRQMLWTLTVICLQFMGDYWIRHVRPDMTERFAQGIDVGVKAIFQQCVGVKVNTWSDVAKERVRLPLCLKGCGLTPHRDTGSCIGRRCCRPTHDQFSGRPRLRPSLTKTRGN